jgi:cytochrome c peroxidase
MRRCVFILSRAASLAVMGLLLVVVSGCTYGRGYYGFHWSYCKFLGYPKVLSCIHPPEADPTLFPTIPYPPNNPQSAQKEELGKMLFFDPRLSSTGKVSCSSCHVPDKGFADPNRFSTGINDQTGDRNAPTVLNTAFHRHLFWDGRAGSLEEQAVGPIENDKEMGPAGNLDKVVKILNNDSEMKAQFQKAFGTDVTAKGIAMALATFERSLISRDTAFERWVREEEPMPSRGAERGWLVFLNKGRCANCHVPPVYTDDGFHNIGVNPHPPARLDGGLDDMLASHPEYKKEYKEFRVDKCAFRTPSLLNVAETAPYMHNGAFNTLEEVISFYTRGGDKPPECGPQDWRIVNLTQELSVKNQKDLVEFLKSLSQPASALVEFLKRLNLPPNNPGKGTNASP